MTAARSLGRISRRYEQAIQPGNHMIEHEGSGGVSESVQIGNATLYHGDCLEILPTLGKVDCVVTDPPYGLGDRMNGGTWGAANKYSDLRAWDVPPDDSWLNSLCSGCQAIVWGGNYFRFPVSRCWLIWDKQNAVSTMADVEMAWTNLEGPAKRLSLPVGAHDYGHPTQKPTRLMEWSLHKTTGPCFDPFMGSGTTGVACANLGRKFIGIEIERKYFDIACERIEATYAQGRLFA